MSLFRILRLPSGNRLRCKLKKSYFEDENIFFIIGFVLPLFLRDGYI